MVDYFLFVHIAVGCFVASRRSFLAMVNRLGAGLPVLGEGGFSCWDCCQLRQPIDRHLSANHGRWISLSVSHAYTYRTILRGFPGTDTANSMEMMNYISPSIEEALAPCGGSGCR